jgi:hypothetical protein
MVKVRFHTTRRIIEFLIIFGLTSPTRKAKISIANTTDSE